MLVTILVTTGAENGLEEDRIHRLGGFPLHAWENVRVDPQGSSDILMPESL